MSNYFDQMPIINYDGYQVRDLTRRNRLLPVSISNPYLFLPYTVSEEDRPEDIAYYYYGSTDYTWLVLLANNIIDPYHQWPLKEDDFNKYLIKKYQQQSGVSGYAVVDWTKNETIDDNIIYYSKAV
jgi:phage terminase large subunit GpA-like protein